MYAQFFGNYLLSHGVVTREQLLETMHRKSSTKIKLGTLAIHAGCDLESRVDRIVILQRHEDKRFGELAIHEGYLTEAEVTKLLAEQKPDFLLLGQALVDEGLINNQQLQELIIDYQSENELDDYSYSEEDQDAIRHMIENFFILAERPLSKYEISFFPAFVQYPLSVYRKMIFHTGFSEQLQGIPDQLLRITESKRIVFHPDLSRYSREYMYCFCIQVCQRKLYRI